MSIQDRQYFTSKEKLHNKKFVASFYLQDIVVLKTMLVRHAVSFWNYGS